MIEAVLFLFGGGVCWRTADDRSGANRAMLRTFALTFLGCGVLALYAWLGVA